MSDNTYNTRLSKNLAKGDTPSVAMLRRLKARDELTIKNDSGDSDVFRPGDWWVQILCAVCTSCCFCWSSFSAFLAHQGVDRNSPLDGHDYWKAQILSIHTFNGRPWLRVRWFYSATQLQQVGHQWVMVCFFDSLLCMLTAWHAPGSLSSNFWEILSWCSVTTRTRYQPTVLKVRL